MLQDVARCQLADGSGLTDTGRADKGKDTALINNIFSDNRHLVRQVGQRIRPGGRQLACRLAAVEYFVYYVIRQSNPLEAATNAGQDERTLRCRRAAHHTIQLLDRKSVV